MTDKTGAEVIDLIFIAGCAKPRCDAVGHGHVQGSAEDNPTGFVLPHLWTGRQCFCQEFQPLRVSLQLPNRLDDNIESVVVARSSKILVHFA
jgi:hypothetical protein